MLDSIHEEDDSNKKNCTYRVMLQMLLKKTLSYNDKVCNVQN
jgi:hypothetical protein